MTAAPSHAENEARFQRWQSEGRLHELSACNGDGMTLCYRRSAARPEAGKQAEPGHSSSHSETWPGTLKALVAAWRGLFRWRRSIFSVFDADANSASEQNMP